MVEFDDHITKLNNLLFSISDIEVIIKINIIGFLLFHRKLSLDLF
jgi:hypothetical protein